MIPSKDFSRTQHTLPRQHTSKRWAFVNVGDEITGPEQAVMVRSLRVDGGRIVAYTLMHPEFHTFGLAAQRKLTAVYIRDARRQIVAYRQAKLARQARPTTPACCCRIAAGRCSAERT